MSRVMARTNGKSEIEPQELDTQHELPPADGADEATGDPPQLGERAQTERDSELEKLKAERDSAIDRLARLQAEFENVRKRTAREQQDFREYAVADTLRALLPVLDSFERALQVSAEEKSELRSGLELIYKQLEDTLAKQGLRPVPAKGELFDP